MSRAAASASCAALLVAFGAACAKDAPTGLAESRDCAKPIEFTSAIFDPNALKVITPIGMVGAGGTELVGRSYMFVKDALDGQRLAFAAPTDLDVVAATRYIPPGAPAGYTPDWSMLLDVGCGFSIELSHVKDVVDAIKAQVPTQPLAVSAYQNLPARVPMKAGDVFGWYVKGTGSIAWDFIVRNNAVTNQFANQARYVTGRSNILNVVCPFSLFTPSTRTVYIALLGSPGGAPVPGAECGSVERDVAGTPQGQWFTSAAFSATWPFSKDGAYGDPLPIAMGPDSTVFIGHLGPTDDVRIFRRDPSWRNPALITTSWCYQVALIGGGWVFVRMNSTVQMDVAYSASGTCPATFPSAGFKAYFR